MTARRTPAVLLACAGALALTVLGCGSGASSSSSSSSDGPIVVGNISTLTGPNQFPEAPGGARAAFTQINAAGGIDGRKIEFIAKDDAGSPATAAQVGQELVNKEGAIAKVGSFSAGGDCAANAQLDLQHQVVTLGFGAFPACQTEKTFGTVNSGGLIEKAAYFQWMAQKFASRRLCYIGINVPGGRDLAENARKVAEAALGKPIDMTLFSISQTPSDSPTPFVVHAKQAGCEVVNYGGSTQQDVAFLKSVQGQGWSPIVLLSSFGYSDAVLSGAGSAANNAYVISDYRPFTGDSPAATKFRAAMKKVDVPPSSFAQGSYVGAQILASILSSLHGDISREAVYKAFTSGRQFHNPMLLSPLTFGPYGYRSIAVLQIKDGKFVDLDESVTVPEDALVKTGIADPSNPAQAKEQ